MHCPSAKENSSATENSIFPDIVAIAIMLASIGEEHGLEASAKNAPTRNGKINKLPFLFWGIFLIIAGNCISSIPSKFNPIMMKIEANNNIKIGEAKVMNALPVKAQITPIMLSMSDNPTEKESI